MQEVEYSCAHFAQTKSGVTIFFLVQIPDKMLQKKKETVGPRKEMTENSPFK